MKPIERGDQVVVTDAAGKEHPRRAVTGVVRGHDFLVVWVCKEDRWPTEPSLEAGAIPWPADAVHRPTALPGGEA